MNTYRRRRSRTAVAKRVGVKGKKWEKSRAESGRIGNDFFLEFLFYSFFTSFSSFAVDPFIGIYVYTASSAPGTGPV